MLRQLRGIPIKVRRAPRSKSWESSSAGPEAEPGGMTKAALYEEARRLGVAGRSNMSQTELARAVASARRSRRSAGPLARLRDKRTGTGMVGFLLALKGLRSASLGDRVNLHSLKSLLRTPGPLRAAILSLVTLAAGVLGLVVAYGVVPSESVAAQGRATTLRLVTVTGPEGTTTMAVTKTKQGKTKIVPVRVLRTVTGPVSYSNSRAHEHANRAEHPDRCRDGSRDGVPACDGRRHATGDRGRHRYRLRRGDGDAAGRAAAAVTNAADIIVAR